MWRTQQRDHHGAVSHEVAGQTDVEHCKPAPAVAVVNPVLCREFDGGGAVDRPEGDLMRALTLLDRRREECLVANKLILIDQPRRDFDPAQTRRKHERSSRTDPSRTAA